MDNPFLKIKNPRPLGPGSFEMALSLVKETGISSGMRVLEVGAGSGQVASVLAKHWNVSVVTLEPWEDLNEIHRVAQTYKVGNSVLAMKCKAQKLPFADGIFDAVISIGSFEMIGDEREEALKEIVRVSRVGACIGIAEPMCRVRQLPKDLKDDPYFISCSKYFKTLEWNKELFQSCNLEIMKGYYFEDGYQLWVDNFQYYDGNKQEILRDNGRWLSLGLLVGRKEEQHEAAYF